MTARKDCFNYFPHGSINDGKSKFPKFRNDKEVQKKRIAKRLALIEEKGFIPDGMIAYNKRAGVIRKLKSFSSDGFIIIEGSNSREDPREWDPIV
ncbi:MAG: hypothetical protein RBS77_03340 [Candidatus Moranbacteria bacterium]|jgi:hypothetical protein|nr:hypothetical protein [Candidatus Moranbacteria bacterium]